MIITRIFLAFVAIFVALIPLRADDYPDFGKLGGKLRDMSAADVKEMGNAFARSEDWENALYCYQTVISRYRPGESSRQEGLATAAAYNNLGYVYFYGRNDYSQAFQSYLHSQEIAEELGDEEMIPYVNLNMGNIYSLYGDDHNMLEYYKRAFEGAKTLGIDDVMLTSLCGLVIHAIGSDVPSVARDQVAQFEALSLPDTVAGVQYARLLTQAFHALEMRRADSAIKLLDKIAHDESVSAMLTSGRLIGQCTLLKAEILKRNGHLTDAIAVVRSVAPASLPDDLRVGFLEMESKILEDMGRPDSALAARNSALTIHDSLYRTQGYGMIRDLRGDWEARRAADRIESADHRRLAALRWLWFVVIIVIIMVGLVLTIVIKNRRLHQSNQALYERVNEANRQYDAMRLQLQALHTADASTPTKWEAPETAEPRPDDDTEDADSTGATDSKGQPQPSIDLALLAKISTALANEASVTSPDFTIDRLAKMIGSNSTYVSKAINTGYGKNFAALLGEVRVRLACARLNDPSFAHLTIEGIATELGFKSRTNFIAVFKRTTGLTPTEYKKISYRELASA